MKPEKSLESACGHWVNYHALKGSGLHLGNLLEIV
jgi:hypothetical protein